MSRCCCGQINLDGGIPLVHNGYQHEVLGEVLGAGRNFCGPKIKHDMRDLREHIDEVEEQLAAATKALEWYANANFGDWDFECSLDAMDKQSKSIKVDRGQVARDALAEIKKLEGRSHE